jgi:hypothetical protein
VLAKLRAIGASRQRDIDAIMDDQQGAARHRPEGHGQVIEGVGRQVRLAQVDGVDARGDGGRHGRGQVSRAQAPVGDEVQRRCDEWPAHGQRTTPSSGLLAEA